MKQCLPFLLISLIAFTGSAYAAGEHDHHHGHEGQAAPAKLKPGQKYESDAPLRSHMKEIRDELQNKMGEVHKGAMKEEGYQELAQKIDKSIQSIFKDCKLKPDADAALHLILADIMAGSAAMKSGASTGDRAKGFIKIAGGLESYAKAFKHPSWKPLKH